ncbi:MAG: RNA methyltransferase, partial [Selenomonadaceae bacterium]|nr:RNA methyltransferase [Selenomonadaceae bacterium]
SLVSTMNKLKLINKLKMKKYRDEFGMYIVEGRRLCDEARQSGAEIIFEITADEIGEREFKRISEVEAPQGIMMIVKRPPVEPIDLNGLIPVLDGLQEPGNVGGIMRTAAAIGCRHLIVLDSTVDPFNPKAVRASMGGIFKLNVVQMSRAELLSMKLPLAAASLDGIRYDQFEFDNPTALVLGSEARGIDRMIMEASRRISIPMVAMESLNVNVAAGVLMYEWRRRANV